MLRPLIERLAAMSRISEVKVFGSVARGEQVTGSDVDLLVVPMPGATLFDIAQFELDMEAVLGAPVDAVSVGGLDEERDDQMIREAVSL
ncbi:MAG: nucleotidyltransferase domain-containing protein [Actinomycetota bacterium]